MESSLLWGAVALGCAGWLSGVLLNRPEATAPRRRMPARLFVVLAAALPLLGFLLSLPTHPPFATGGLLGRGILLGGVAALAGAWALLRCPQCSPLAVSARVLSPWFAAAAAVPGGVLILYGSPFDGLLGIAIGWLCVTAVLAVGLLADPETAAGRDLASLVAPLGFAMTECAATALCLNRDSLTPPPGPGAWCVASTTLAVSVPFVLLIAALPTPVLMRVAMRLPLAGLFARVTSRLLATESARRAASGGWRLLLAISLLVGIAELLATRLLLEARLPQAVAIGTAAALVAWSVLADPQGRTDDESTDGSARALAALAMLAGLTAANYRLTGLGVLFAAAAAWMIPAMLLGAADETPDDERTLGAAGLAPALTALGFFGALYAVLRFTGTVYGDDLPTGLTDQFAIFGFLTGALLPVVLAGAQVRRARDGTMSMAGAAWRLLLHSLVALAVPGLLAVLLHSRSLLPFLTGLCVAPLLGVIRTSRDGDAAGRATMLAAVFASVPALAVAQWTGHVLAIGPLSRDARIHALLWIVGSIVALGLAGQVSERAAAWVRARRDGRTPRGAR